MLGIRLISIYLLAKGVIALPNLVEIWTYPETDSYLVINYTLAILMPIFVGVALFLLSKKLSNFVCGDIEIEESEYTNLTSNDLYNLGFSLAGLFIIVFKIPDYINVIVNINLTANMNDRQAEYFSNPHFLSEFGVILIGIFLFFGSRFWVRLYKWAQGLGLENK